MFISPFSNGCICFSVIVCHISTAKAIDIERLQLWMMRVFQILGWDVSDRSGRSSQRKSKIAYLTYSKNRNIFFIPIYSIFWKLFLVKNSNSCLNDMFVYTGCLPILVDLDIRKYNFLCKLLSSDNFVLNKLYHMFGAKELNDLSGTYNVEVEHSFLNFSAILLSCYFNIA